MYRATFQWKVSRRWFKVSRNTMSLAFGNWKNNILPLISDQKGTDLVQKVYLLQQRTMRWKSPIPSGWVKRTFFPVFNKYEQPTSHLPIIKLLSNYSIRDELRIPKFHPKGHPKSKIEQNSIPVGCVPYPVVSHVPCIWGWGGGRQTPVKTLPSLNLVCGR